MKNYRQIGIGIAIGVAITLLFVSRYELSNRPGAIICLNRITGELGAGKCPGLFEKGLPGYGRKK